MKKVETSKKLLYLNYMILIVLIILVVVCTFMQIDCSNLATVAGLVAVEVGASTSFYYSMNKKLNMPKVVKHIYDDLPEDLRAGIDVNSLIGSMMN